MTDPYDFFVAQQQSARAALGPEDPVRASARAAAQWSVPDRRPGEVTTAAWLLLLTGPVTVPLAGLLWLLSAFADTFAGGHTADPLRRLFVVAVVLVPVTCVIGGGLLRRLTWARELASWIVVVPAVALLGAALLVSSTWLAGAALFAPTLIAATAFVRTKPAVAWFG